MDIGPRPTTARCTAVSVDPVGPPGPLVDGDVGYLVTGEHCDRCGDVNYDEATRVCLTCTYPDHPCSRAYLEQP